MKEFEGVDVRLHFDGRNVKRHGIVGETLELVRFDIFTEERICHSVGDFLEGEVLNVVKKRPRQLLDTLWHVEPFVGSESTNDGFFERSEWGGGVGAVVFHVVG